MPSSGLIGRVVCSQEVMSTACVRDRGGCNGSGYRLQHGPTTHALVIDMGEPVLASNWVKMKCMLLKQDSVLLMLDGMNVYALRPSNVVEYDGVRWSGWRVLLCWW